MRRRRRSLLTPSLFFLAAFLLFCASVANSFAPDGVLVLHLNADFGEVRQGQELKQMVHIINCTLQPVHVLSVPTCGCTIVDNRDRALPPFDTLNVPIGYHVGIKQHGRSERDFVILYRIGKRLHRVDGTARFTVKP